MTDESTPRPRRAMAQGDDQVDPVELDDTAAETTYPGRRGRFSIDDDTPTAGRVARSDQGPVGAPGATRGGAPAAPTGATPPHSPWVVAGQRPWGSEQPGPGATAAGGPGQASPGGSRRGDQAAGQDAGYEQIFRPGDVPSGPGGDDKGPSTVTMTIPHAHSAFMRPGMEANVEVEVPLNELAIESHEGDQSGELNLEDPQVVAAAMEAAKKTLPATPLPSTAADLGNLKSAPEPPEDALHDDKADRRGPSSMVKVGIGVLALAVLGGGALGIKSLMGKDDQASNPGSSGATNQSGSVIAAAVNTGMLVAPPEVKGALGGDWSVRSTHATIDGSVNEFITCEGGKNAAIPNATGSVQQLLTESKNGQALLQRIDSYATEVDAQKAFKARNTALAACDTEGTLIQSAAQITGAGDEAASLTVRSPNLQGSISSHTVLLVRNGLAVTMMDVADNSKAVDAGAALKATTPTLTKVCGPAKGTCPKDPTATPTVVPPTPTVGWLASSDIPRISVGNGAWSPLTPGPIDGKFAGSTCEGVNLATSSKAAKAQQGVYQLLKDPAAPQNYGFDELRYSFADAKGATTWSKQLTDALDGCAKKSPGTTKTTDVAEVKGVGERKAPVTGKTWKVSLDIGSEKLVIRISVVTSGTQVAYLAAKEEAGFGFTLDQWKALSARAGERSTQGG